MTVRRIRRFLLALGLVVAVSTTTSACSPTQCVALGGTMTCPSPN